MAVESPRDPDPDRRSFIDWLKRVPTDFKLLAAATAAIGGVLAPERLIPVPLSDYRWIPSLVIVLGLALTWAWQRQLREHRRALTAITLLLLLAVLALNLRYVRAVDYQNPQETISYLTGEVLTDPGLCGATAQVVIQQCGGDWDALETAWGASFQAVAFGYALCYVLFVTSIVLSLGAVMLERAPPSPRELTP
jgi:hypothetical protein